MSSTCEKWAICKCNRLKNALEVLIDAIYKFQKGIFQKKKLIIINELINFESLFRLEY